MPNPNDHRKRAMRLTFRKIEMVEAIVKLGSISAAARAIGISQPALTQGIQAVEADLGVTLFSRGHGGLQPTEFALPFLTYASQIRAEIEAAKIELLAHRHAKPDTQFRIAAGIRSCNLWINEASRWLAKSFQGLTIAIDHELLNLYARLVGGEVDIGITMTELLPPQADGLRIESLGEWRAHFVCREGHPLTQLPECKLADLRPYPLAGDYNFPILVRMFESEGLLIDDRELASGWLISAKMIDSLGAMIELVKTSDSLAIMPEDTISYQLTKGEIVALELANMPNITLKVVFAFLDQEPLPEPLRSFIEMTRSIEARRAKSKLLRTG